MNPDFPTIQAGNYLSSVFVLLISFLTLGMKKTPSFVHKKCLSYIQKKEGENTASDMQFFSAL